MKRQLLCMIKLILVMHLAEKCAPAPRSASQARCVGVSLGRSRSARRRRNRGPLIKFTPPAPEPPRKTDVSAGNSISCLGGVMLHLMGVRMMNHSSTRKCSFVPEYHSYATRVPTSWRSSLSYRSHLALSCQVHRKTRVRCDRLLASSRPTILRC